MRKKFKKLVGFTTAVAMAVSLVPTNVFAEEPEVAVAEESAKNDNLLRVWYDEPATDWQTESLAIGNGYMGGLVFGGINNDKIHINEKTVWEGGPADSYDYTGFMDISFLRRYCNCRARLSTGVSVGYS